MKRANIMGEAAQKLGQIVEILKAGGCAEEAGLLEDTASGILYNAAKRPVDPPILGAGLRWRMVPVTSAAVYLDGHRYSSWHNAVEASKLSDTWRLPTPEELKALYAEQPDCEVFKAQGYAEYLSNGRYRELKAVGVGDVVAVWTNQDDSRDFAIECTLTPEFGLTFHPALKTRLIAAWLVYKI